MPGGGEREAIAREPVEAPQRERDSHERERRGERRRDRQSAAPSRPPQNTAVADDRGHGEDHELAGGEPERETVLHLHVGRQPDTPPALTAHPRAHP